MLAGKKMPPPPPLLYYPPLQVPPAYASEALWAAPARTVIMPKALERLQCVAPDSSDEEPKDSSDEE